MQQQIIKHLRGLADGSIKPDNKNCGIYQEIYAMFHIEIISNVWDKWEHFSGSYLCPVPSPKGYPDCPEDAYSYGFSNKWANNEYGD